MSDQPDQALWVGPTGCHLGDGTELVPHETIANVSRGEAEASDNWEPLAGKRPRKAASKRKRAPRAKAPKAPDVKTQETKPSESAGTQTGAGAPSEPGGGES